MRGQCNDKNKNKPMTNVLNWAVNHLGMAVVNLYPDPDDSWMWYQDYLFSDGYDFQCDTSHAIDNMCWNNGNNPDKAYLDTVMYTLLSHRHIDYDNMVLNGYSAGAQMVSAAMSIFPTELIHSYQSTQENQKKTSVPSSIVKYPKISGAFMIGGGSQYCYMDAGSGLRAPSPMGQCGNSGYDCCPYNATEKIYMEGTLPYEQHPPVVMFQTQKDSNAAHDASIKYYNTAAAYNFPAVLVTAKGKYHGLVEEQSYIMAKMIQHFVKIKRD